MPAFRRCVFVWNTGVESLSKVIVYCPITNTKINTKLFVKLKRMSEKNGKKKIRVTNLV